MSHEERNTVIQIIIGFCINAYVIWRLNALNQSGAFDGPDAVALWANTVLWIVFYGVIFGVVAAIVGNIIFAIIYNESKPSFVVDERDSMMSHFGNKIIIGCISTGFIASLFAMAFGLGAIEGLTAILLSFSVGSLIGEIGKFIRYRMAI